MQMVQGAHSEPYLRGTASIVVPRSVHPCTDAHLGATPIFTTIYSLDLATWNNIRLNQRKTSVLNYESDYNSMQIALNEAISLVNDAIITLNKNMMVATPMIHKCLLHNVRKGIKHWQYHKLVDGCHPNEPIKEDIANSLNRAIQLNRNL